MPQVPPSYPVVIWFGRVGDMIMLSALLEILHRRFARPCRVIGAGAWTSEIYRSHSDVDEVICLGRHTAFFLDRGWWRARRALRADPTAPVYVCETFPGKLRRVRRLLRWSGTSASRCVFMNDVLAASDKKPEHWVDRLVELGRRTPAAFRAADFPWPQPAPRCAPRLEIGAAARADCEAWLAARGWLGRPLVLVQPGNRRTMRGARLELSPQDDKAWPIERWAALLRLMHAHLPQAIVILVGAPKESALLGWIHAAAALPAVVTAELPLSRLFALCASASSMISVDTGPAHAAAAVGLPLVVLFGGHSQREWLPRGASGSSVLGIGGPPVSSRLDQISEHVVFEAWRKLHAGIREIQPT